MTLFVTTIVATIIVSGVLVLIPNKSNMPNQLAIPVLTALFIKYAIGDWDEGYQWSVLDMLYWVTILATSLAVSSLQYL